jgi:hypothetical protein
VVTSMVCGKGWPNRLYAMCGHAAGSRDGHPHNLPPLYNQPSFVRYLDAHGVSWRWYCTDVGTLRMADELYCLGHHDRFGYFTTTGLPWKAVLNWRVQAAAVRHAKARRRRDPRAEKPRTSNKPALARRLRVDLAGPSSRGRRSPLTFAQRKHSWHMRAFISFHHFRNVGWVHAH